MKGNGMTKDAWEHLNDNGRPVTTYNQVNNKAMSEITVWTFSREAALLEAWFEIRHGARSVHLNVPARTITHRREISMSYYYNEIVLGGDESQDDSEEIAKEMAEWEAEQNKPPTELEIVLSEFEDEFHDIITGDDEQ